MVSGHFALLEISQEPSRREVCHRLQRSPLLKKVSSAGDNGDLTLTTHNLLCFAIEVLNLWVVPPYDKE